MTSNLENCRNNIDPITLEKLQPPIVKFHINPSDISANCYQYSSLKQWIDRQLSQRIPLVNIRDPLSNIPFSTAFYEREFPEYLHLDNQTQYTNLHSQLTAILTPLIQNQLPPQSGIQEILQTIKNSRLTYFQYTDLEELITDTIEDTRLSPDTNAVINRILSQINEKVMELLRPEEREDYERPQRPSLFRRLQNTIRSYIPRRLRRYSQRGSRKRKSTSRKLRGKSRRVVSRKRRVSQRNTTRHRARK